MVAEVEERRAVEARLTEVEARQAVEEAARGGDGRDAGAELRIAAEIELTERIAAA